MFTIYLKLIDFFPKESLNKIQIHTSSIFILIKSIPFYFITTLLSTHKKNQKKTHFKIAFIKIILYICYSFFYKNPIYSY